MELLCHVELILHPGFHCDWHSELLMASFLLAAGGITSVGALCWGLVPVAGFFVSCQTVWECSLKSILSLTPEQFPPHAGEWLQGLLLRSCGPSHTWIHGSSNLLLCPCVRNSHKVESPGPSQFSETVLPSKAQKLDGWHFPIILTGST